MTVQGDEVHISFHENGTVTAVNVLAGQVETVQIVFLRKYAGLRRIQILRSSVRQSSASEADDFSSRVKNRKHHSIPEFIESSAF